jgi:ribonucleoside-triphosphate reductase (thioredoxin)
LEHYKRDILTSIILRDIWKRTTEKDALIGVGMTGIGSGVVLGYDMKKAAKMVKEENERVASSYWN